MDLIDEAAHRILAYIKALNSGGYRPTRDELDAYASGWSRRVQYEGTVWANVSLQLSQILANKGLVGRNEALVDYLCRIRAVETEDGRYLVTPLGGALLPALEAPSVLADEHSVVEVLSVGDEFALSRILARIGAAGPDAMLADPYLTHRDALSLAATTGVTRLLVGERGKAKERDAIRAALPAMTLDRLVKARVAGKELHDRCLIPVTGPVTMIGGSLNGAGKHLTILTPFEDPSGAVRTTYETLWGSADPLAESAPPLGSTED